MDFEDAVDLVGRIIEALGIAAIVLGVLASLVKYSQRTIVRSGPRTVTGRPGGP